MQQKIKIIIFSVIICIMILVSTLSFIQPSNFWTVEPENAWVITIITIIFTASFIWVMAKRKWISHLPEQTIKATISAKNVVVKRETSYDSDSNSYEREETYYKLTFETEKQNQWTFDVSLDLYNSFLKGDYGTLVYKESKRGKIYYDNFFREK